jgi:integrase
LSTACEETVPESLDVRIYKVQKVNRPKPHYLRWKVGGVPFGQAFAQAAMADTYRSRLISATRAGEPFDTETGEPVSWAKKEDAPEKTVYELSVEYCAMKWPQVAPNSRTGIAEALAVLAAALVAEKPGRPADDVLREALYGWAFNVTARKREPAAGLAAALRWIEDASLPVTALNKASTTRGALQALATLLDGSRAAPSTFTRKRATFYNLLRYALEAELLQANPLDRVQWKVPKKVEAVDPRVVANPTQVRRILAKLAKRRPDLVAFFACLYFAAMRPGEAVYLNIRQCHLPEKGWGRLDLTTTATRAGRAWTDTGEAHDVRGLKHRATGDIRPVPIPPELVKYLRAHLDQFGTTPDGRLFRGTRSGGYLSESTYGPFWKTARATALGADQATSKLAERPYDLRHGGVSLMLASGVPAPEVARRAGHSVEVLLRVYAKCIDGQQDAMNRRIENALGDDGDTAAFSEDDHSGRGLEPPESDAA